MRVRHTIVVAILAAVTMLSFRHADAAGSTQGGVPKGGVPQGGVTVRMDAIDAAPARPNLMASGTPWNKAAGPRRSTRAGHLAFVDEMTPWVISPGQDVPVITDGGYLQCVPYARMISGIGIRGDAWTWWDKATGTYARGNLPEPGAVLSFPGIERMPLGHVAVVTQVLEPRKILIEHANWPTATVRHGAISQGIQVADVSYANDWTEVRVQFGSGGPLGSVYPANGFIYGWSETGIQIARPRWGVHHAGWSPVTASWRMFNPIAYVWALPKGLREKIYASTSRTPGALSAQNVASALNLRSAGGRTPLLLGQTRSGASKGAFGSGTFGQILGVNRLDLGSGSKMGAAVNRFVMQ